ALSCLFTNCLNRQQRLWVIREYPQLKYAPWTWLEAKVAPLPKLDHNHWWINTKERYAPIDLVFAQGPKEHFSEEIYLSPKARLRDALPDWPEGLRENVWNFHALQEPVRWPSRRFKKQKKIGIDDDGSSF